MSLCHPCWDLCVQTSSRCLVPPLFERQTTQSHEGYLKGMHRKFEIFLRQIVSDSDDG